MMQLLKLVCGFAELYDINLTTLTFICLTISLMADNTNIYCGMLPGLRDKQHSYRANSVYI